MPQHEVKLGELIVGEEKRDAIHIAVAPVIADEKLYPGQEIVLVKNSTSNVVAAGQKKPTGIVDPFLKLPVFPGHQFWMFLFPQTITSLRHDWDHPAFAVKAEEVQPDVQEDPKVESIKWIQKFANKLGHTYDDLMRVASAYNRGGDYEYDNSEGYKNHWDEFPEFWKHYTKVTGESVNDPGVPYSCSC